MTPPPSPAPPEADSKSPPGESFVRRLLRFVLLALLPLILGFTPFVLGVAVQALIRRRLPSYGIGMLAAATFFTLRHFTDWLPIRVGDGGPAWPSVVLSLLLFSAFFSLGATLFRELFARHFGPEYDPAMPAPPAPKNPDSSK
jgi:hypothetical protein